MKPKVSVYIDGFNFYYRAILGRGPRYQYPSLQALCRAMLDNTVIQYELNEIHYFTAEVQSTADDPTKQRRQRNYNNALKREGVNIHYGKFTRYKKDGPRKEKQSDVNLAVCMLNDAWKDKYDYGVLLSNDRDFVEVLRVVANERGKVVAVWSTVKTNWALANKATYRYVIPYVFIEQAPRIAN